MCPGFCLNIVGLQVYGFHNLSMYYMVDTEKTISLCVRIAAVHWHYVHPEVSSCQFNKLNKREYTCYVSAVIF